MATLESLRFDNGFARLPESFYSRVCPTPVPDPYLVCYSPEALALLDLDAHEMKRPELIETLAGNRLLPGMEALAALYAGHQFGHYVPQLGDGRAILLGEVKNAAGEGWEVQIKGAGRTPYSRGGDGRAVLRSSIREFLCSEAMHALGIPTTRALAIVGSDHPVYREDEETAALVTRLAPSFVRFGSFEVFYYRNQIEPIRHLADYVIALQFSGEQCKCNDSGKGKNKDRQEFKQCCEHGAPTCMVQIWRRQYPLNIYLIHPPVKHPGIKCCGKYSPERINRIIKGFCYRHHLRGLFHKSVPSSNLVKTEDQHDHRTGYHDYHLNGIGVCDSRESAYYCKNSNYDPDIKDGRHYFPSHNAPEHKGASKKGESQLGHHTYDQHKS